VLASICVHDFTIRPAQTADIPAVLAVWAVGRSAHAGVADSAEGIAKLLAFDPGALLVAESEATLVATLIATWDGWRGAMYRLAVLPEYRRHGIARDLVAAGHRRLAERGVTRITALVAHDDARARGFWFSAGYSHDEAMGRFVLNL
jgi:ribosomal protein S18 acetylase RimI-like enzyme